MDFKRVKNDDHPHKWACQIQDRVLEEHFKQGDYLFWSAGGNMNICWCVNHTAVLYLGKGQAGKRCYSSAYKHKLLDMSRLNVRKDAEVASLCVEMMCGDVCAAEAQA